MNCCPASEDPAAIGAFDDEFLASLGLGHLAPADRRRLRDALMAEWATRIGAALAERVDATSLADFERLVACGRLTAARALMDERCPGHDAVVRRELERLRVDLIVAVLPPPLAGGPALDADCSRPDDDDPPERR